MRYVALSLSIFFFFVFLFSYPVLGTIGLGLDPTRANIRLSNSQREVVLPIKLFNPSNTNVVMTINPSDNLRRFIVCRSGYWCDGLRYRVTTNNTMTNPVVVNVLFKKYFDLNTNFTDSIFVVAEIEHSGMIGIQPRVEMIVTLKQEGTQSWTPTTTTTSAPSSNNGNQNNQNQNLTDSNATEICEGNGYSVSSINGLECDEVVINNIICYRCVPKETTTTGTENTTGNDTNANIDASRKNLLSSDNILLLSGVGITSIVATIGGWYYFKKRKSPDSSIADVD